MRFATYIFDAKSHQDPALTSFLHLARRVPSEMKITKIDRAVILGRPGGMRGLLGKGFGMGTRPWLISDLEKALLKHLDFLLLKSSTLCPPSGAAERFAHSAGPTLDD